MAYPPDQSDILLSWFAIYEEDTEGDLTFLALGALSSISVNGLPKKATLRSDGNATSAVDSGGISPYDTDSFRDHFVVGETIGIAFSIAPELQEIGKVAKIFVVLSDGENLLQVTASGLIPFNGTVEGLMEFDEIVLTADNAIDILENWSGQLMLTGAEVGDYLFYMGYGVDAGVIT